MPFPVLRKEGAFLYYRYSTSAQKRNLKSFIRKHQENTSLRENDRKVRKTQRSTTNLHGSTMFSLGLGPTASEAFIVVVRGRERDREREREVQYCIRKKIETPPHLIQSPAPCEMANLAAYKTSPLIIMISGML